MKKMKKKLIKTIKNNIKYNLTKNKYNSNKIIKDKKAIGREETKIFKKKRREWPKNWK